MTPAPLVLLAGGGYLLLVLVIAGWALRRTRTARDFFIAGQRAGLVATALATMSAAFSGFVFLGGPGLMYQLGTGSLLICAPVGFTAALLCWVLAKRLRLLAAVREIYTVPDAIAARYRSRLAGGLAAGAIALGSIGYLAAQFLALGVLADATLGLSSRWGDGGFLVGFVGAVLVVLAYAATGGMLAGLYTDVLQGAVMLVASIGVFGLALAAPGGPAAIVASIAGSERFGADFLAPLGSTPALLGLGFTFLFGVGVLGQPHMLHKFYMLDDPRKLRWLPALLGGSQTVVLLVWLGIGAAVPALVAQGQMEAPAPPDQAAPLFLLQFAPEALAGIVFAGVLAAVMSTADSFLNIASAALVRDLPRAVARPLRSELPAARFATVLVAAAAAGLALAYDDLIALLGTFAFGTFAAALAPALAVGLNWSRATSTAACASIVTGLALSLGLELLARTPAGLTAVGLAPGTLPGAVALGGSLVVLVAVSLLSRRPEALDADVQAVLEL
jgi:Na+/proline symporter